MLRTAEGAAGRTGPEEGVPRIAREAERHMVEASRRGREVARTAPGEGLAVGNILALGEEVDVPDIAGVPEGGGGA